MPTDKPTLSNDGFTLVEVLIAMVILAIGLLGLEALAIGAARSVALADRQSGFATIAADSLESAMHLLRQNNLPVQFCQSDLGFGDRLSRSVDVVNPQLVAVTVRILPGSTTLTAPTDTYQISSSVFSPLAFTGSVQGAPCA